MKTLKKKYIKVIFFMFIASCAQEKPISYEDNYIQDFKQANLFYIKENYYKMNCDSSENKLLMRYSKKEEKWIRSKYISKGCNLKWRNHIN